MHKVYKIGHFLIIVTIILIFFYINFQTIPSLILKNEILGKNNVNNKTLSKETLNLLSQNNIKIFTEQELKLANKKTKCYIAYKGIIYDVTKHPLWANCEHSGYIGGFDATTLFPHPPSYLNALPKVGVLLDYISNLNEEEILNLISLFIEKNAKEIPVTEVNKHNSYQSCWVIINNYVYDVTDFIPQHPGGSEILDGCGKNLDSLFSKGIHKEKGMDYLITYQIGQVIY